MQDLAQPERIAAQAKVPVGALIRGWVLTGLAAERGTSLRDAIDHLARKPSDYGGSPPSARSPDRPESYAQDTRTRSGACLWRQLAVMLCAGL